MIGLSLKAAREALEDAFDLPFKVRVYQAYWHPGEQGLSKVSKDGKNASIKINKELPELLQIEVLVHEYAHLLSWNYYGKHQDAVWGVAYAECYDVVYGGH